MELQVSGLSLSPTWVLAIGSVVLFLLYDYWCRGYWRRRGVASVPSWPIIGNLRDFTQGIASAHVCFAKEHGRVYGFYDVRRPVLVCGDPDMARQVMIKSFNSFVNRRTTALCNKEFEDALRNLKDDHWRDVRNTLTSTFSGAKMKQVQQRVLMSHHVTVGADRLLRNIENTQRANGYIECKQLYGSFIMDTIASCAFGLEVDSQGDQDHPFVAMATKAFHFTPFNVGLLISDAMEFFRDVTQQTMAMRKAPNKDKQKRADFLQMMIEAQIGSEGSEGDDDETGHEVDVHDSVFKGHESGERSRSMRSKIKLTDSEIIAQAIIFFVAGYDTTGSLLIYSSYLLALHPDVQEKLITEIDELLPSSNDVDYTTVSKLSYLDNVICETLRCFPPVVLLDRVCNETFTYNGVTVERGTQVVIPMYAIHHDPELWPEPEKFDPDRFTKERREKRHPFAWIPFGAGPRNCIGMRFALMEAKVALVRVLQKYRFETCLQTKIPVEIGKAGLITPSKGMALRVNRRIT
ncbi:cytochrome P450 3A8-like [Diadema antillarum]|uniref:cytochrome P450 3A8-like n=1 Tax=Diadema antillarum TaxID=105358 RepID=UPI003A87692E